MNPMHPKWFLVARSYLGLKEIVGPKHNATLQKWLVNLRAWWKDDETPWCGVAMAQWMKESGLSYPKAYYRAKAWAEWGIDIPDVVPFGAVGVWDRKGGGHVGLIVGVNRHGNYMVLGGNQGNQVSIVPISNDRLIAVRWPSEVPVAYGSLPFYEDHAQLSTNEA